MSAPPPTCDVLVVGSGPGGSMTATFLAQRGYDVVLVDRVRHPRNTVGESLIPYFWRFCDLAGVTTAIEAANFTHKGGGITDWNGDVNCVSFKDFGWTRPSLHVERDEFDEILFRHAKASGARAFEECIIERIEPGEPVISHYRTVAGESGTITSQFTVDATGQTALLGRQLDLRANDPDFAYIALWGYYTGSSYVAADGSVQPAENAKTIPAMTYVTSLPCGAAGWCWHIQLRDKTSVGMVMPVAHWKAERARLGSPEAVFLSECEKLPFQAQLLAKAELVPASVSVINNYSYRCARLTAPGCFMVGDASGFIDPVFSIGVSLAMYGAHVATWAIERSMKNPSRTESSRAMFEHQVLVRQELSRRLARPGALPQLEVTDPRLGQMMAMFSGEDTRLIQAVTGLSGRGRNLDAFGLTVA